MGGGPGGEGEGKGEVVVGGRGAVGEAGELFEDAAAGGKGAGDAEETGFKKDAEAGEEVAAGDEPATVRVRGGVAARGDRDGEDRDLKGHAAEEFDDGCADAGGVDGESAVRVGGMAAQDRPERRAGRSEQRREAAEEIEIRHAKRETVREAETEDEAGAGFEGDRVGVAGGQGDALEEDERGGVVAAAEIEAEEEVGFGEGGGGFDGEDHEPSVAGAGRQGRGGDWKWLMRREISTAKGRDGVVKRWGAAQKAGRAGEGKSAAEAAPVDLNSATVEELRAIPGIGEAYSAKIVRGRPYERKDELVQRGILPRGV